MFLLSEKVCSFYVRSISFLQVMEECNISLKLFADTVEGKLLDKYQKVSFVSVSKCNTTN